MVVEWIGTKEEPIEVDADEILGAIADGKSINVGYAVINGDLQIKKISFQLKKDIDNKLIIPGNIRIWSSKINGQVNFSQAKLKGWIDFKFTQFEKPTVFSGAIFQAQTSFRYAQFKDITHFSDVIFLVRVDFRNAQFNKDITNFKGAISKNGADLRGAQFESRFDSLAKIFNMLCLLPTETSYHVTFTKVAFSVVVPVLIYLFEGAKYLSIIFISLNFIELLTRTVIERPFSFKKPFGYFIGNIIYILVAALAFAALKEVSKIVSGLGILAKINIVYFALSWFSLSCAYSTLRRLHDKLPFAPEFILDFIDIAREVIRKWHYKRSLWNNDSNE